MKNLKCTVLALTMGASVFIGGKAFAQVPSYVPTNGLVGWWPFNGNANDESGNGNNGTVNGSTLVADRFGNVGKAYSFDGLDDFIELGSISGLSSTKGITLSIWLNYLGSNGSTSEQFAFLVGGSPNAAIVINENNGEIQGTVTNCNCPDDIYVMDPINLSEWTNVVLTYDLNIGLTKFYINGIIADSSVENMYNYYTTNNDNERFGNYHFDSHYFNGLLDEGAIWNRPLTQQEITALYNGCGNEITSQPVNANISAGSNAQFSVNAIAGSSCQWQSNPLNMGWQNITNNSSYSGATSNTLSVSNAAVSNHNQPFRAIVIAGTCIDTSDIAQIIIGDTCLSTTYDTLLTTVTDTLIINTTLSLPSPNNANTIKIYPNPASDHFTIDNGNFAAMAGYSIKITNNAGQQVFQNAINQAQFNVDLGTWSGNGLYFVHLIDSQNNTVTIRKIVLQ